MKDMVRKGRMHDQRGEKNNGAKLSDAQAAKIIRLHEAGFRQHELAKKFKVGQPTISRIVNKVLRPG